MRLSSSVRALNSFSRPFHVRLIAIVLMIALAMPMVMFSEWSTTRARTRESNTRPNVAPPEVFKMPGERSTSEALVDSFKSYGRQVHDLLGINPQVVPRQPKSPSVEESTIVGPKDQPHETGITRQASDETAVVPETTDETELNAEITEELLASEAAMTLPPGTVDFDYNGDTKSDVSRWDPVNKVFEIKYSGGGGITPSFSSASSGAKPAPANYDRSTGSNSHADAAVFDSGTWYIRMSGTGSTSTISFGQAGDIPMPGNYIGASTTDDELAFYRPSNGTWYWREVGTTTIHSLAWGNSTDIPVAGDYDGDGAMDWAVYRPSTGYWWIVFNAGGYTAAPWGIAEDIPVAADYS